MDEEGDGGGKLRAGAACEPSDCCSDARSSASDMGGVRASGDAENDDCDGAKEGALLKASREDRAAL